jgi:hypothetical protein
VKYSFENFLGGITGKVGRSSMATAELLAGLRM